MADKPNSRSVMVVDDSGVFGFTLSLEFRKAGWDVFCCGNGEEALKRLTEQDFDLVLSDMFMPGIRGDELARTILRDRPTTRIIIMSSMPKEKIPPLPKGVAFLEKPISVSKILSAFDRSARTTGVVPPPPPPAAGTHG